MENDMDHYRCRYYVARWETPLSEPGARVGVAGVVVWLIGLGLSAQSGGWHIGNGFPPGG
jgi:hypothetical protein